MLTTLLQRRGRVQTRERLLDDVWGISADVTTRTVDTHVKRLREKLGAAGYQSEDRIVSGDRTVVDVPEIVACMTIGNRPPSASRGETLAPGVFPRDLGPATPLLPGRHEGDL